MECPKCKNTKIEEEANFCPLCGTKLKDSCKCWVIKKDNYYCGKNSCPGYEILVKNKMKSSR